MISRSIANRRQHEELILRILAAALHSRTVTIENPARRQYILDSGTRRVLVETTCSSFWLEAFCRPVGDLCLEGIRP